MGSDYEALSETTKNGEESDEARQPRQLWNQDGSKRSCNEDERSCLIHGKIANKLHFLLDNRMKIVLKHCSDILLAEPNVKQQNSQ